MGKRGPKITEIKPRKPESTKKQRITLEANKLKKFYEDLPAEKLFIAHRLIARAAFQRVTLEDLEAEINKTGVVEEYQNGDNQKGMKQSAAVQAYNSMYKNYQATLRDLAAMVPAAKVVSKFDAFRAMNE